MTKTVRRFVLGAAVLGLGGFAAEAKAGLDLTVDAAGVQESQVAGVTTETFTTFTPGQYTSLNTAVGVLTSTGSEAIVVADQFGGAGGTGNYFSIGAQSNSASGATLTFSGPQSYFGFWWSAADPNNSVEFLSNGVQVGSTYTSATVLDPLDSSYLGNPNNPSEDSGEKFAYVNFTGTGGTTFDQVIFSNPTTGTGFESDNFSIAASVPEPSSLVLCGLGGAFGLGFLRRRRRPGTPA